MTDIQLLPRALQERSLSKQEIVLPYPEALQALEFLVAANWALLGWEGWVKYPDGRYGHAPNAMGTTALDQEDGEDWATYVQRSARFCHKTIEAEQQLWDADPQHASLALYFCLASLEPIPVQTSRDVIDNRSLQISKITFVPATSCS